MSVSVCLFACLSVCLCVCPRAYLRNYTSDLFQNFSHVTLWPWLGPTLAASRSVTRVQASCAFYGRRLMFARNQSRATMSIQLQRVTSSRRRAQANAPAASYWLYVVSYTTAGAEADRCDTRLYLFSQRVIVNKWNNLSQEDVDAQSINCFKNRLEKRSARYGLL